MADNVDVTEGSGKTVASDDIQVDGSHAQGQVQFVKLVDGTLNGTGSVRVNQAAKANALTVAPASDISDATYIGDIKFGEAVYTEDVATPATIIGLATVMERDDALGGLTPAEGDWASLRCDANGALWTHDDALDAAIDGAYLNVNLNIAGTDCDGGSGAQGAQTLRVILATDDPAVALLTTIDSDTNNIKTAVEALDNAVDGNFLNCNMCLAGNDTVAGEGAIDSNTLRVTIATDDDGVAHLATIAGDTTAIETAIEIIDDWDATHDSAVSADGPQLMAAYDSTKPTAVDSDADAVRVLADAYGRLLAGVEPERFQATITSADAQSATQVKVKTAGKKMYILTLIVSTDTAMNIQFQDDTGPTVLIEQLYLAANGGAVMNFPPEAPLVVNTNEDFDVIASAAGNISVTITGYLAV